MALRHAPHAILAIAVLAVVALLVLGTPSHAQEGEKIHSVYMSVDGEGPNAKAWYNGAPPAGQLVQQALDHWSEKGYHVKEIRPYLRPFVTVVSSDSGSMQGSTDRDEAFVIILEKIGS